MPDEKLKLLLKKLINQKNETEWIEFKLNFQSSEKIGEYLSALSNGACLAEQPCGYLIFGVKNDNYSIVGTTFRPKTAKHQTEDLEHWLAQRVSPRIDFHIYEFDYEGKHIALFEIPAATNQPTNFQHTSYIRIGSIKRSLKDFPEKERKIWNMNPGKTYEEEIILDSLSEGDVINLLNIPCYFDLMNLPLPTTQYGMIQKFLSEKFIAEINNSYGITNLGALLFAKDLNAFDSLTSKAIRVIVYNAKNKLDTLKNTKDITGGKGYAIGFESLVDYINDQLPQREEIKHVLRTSVTMYPPHSVRELVANALIHQDFSEKGNPTIEIYSDRIEFINPGLPLIKPMHFIDENQSRNEILAKKMRKLGICEEKGSGIDKVIASCELYQLPAPNFIIQEKHTKAIMYAYQSLNNMDKQDKIRACYQHACLKYISNEKMTNQSLRQRFQITEKNAAIASRIIRDTLEAGLIKESDSSNKSRKYTSYLPVWA